MTPLVDELPNLEAAVNVWLDADGLRAYSSIPGRSPEFPLLVSMRLGGRPGDKLALSGGRIQLEAWGGSKETDGEASTKTAVWDLVRQAWRRLLEAEGEIVEIPNGERVHITAVEPEIEPQWLPDPPTGRPRYIASFRVYGRALAPSP